MSTDTPLLMALATRLIICALQARDLPNLDSDEHFGRDASDPYLGIFVGDGAECFSTPVRDESHPLVNLCCDMGEQPPDAVIDVAVADADLPILDAGEDDLLGHGCTSNSGLQWVDLTAPDGSAAGAVQLVVHRLPVDAHYSIEVETHTASSSTPSASAACPEATSLLGCSCSIQDRTEEATEGLQCASARVVSGNRCVATANVNALRSQDGRVVASARCLKQGRVVASLSTSAELSRSTKGDASSAHCEAGVLSCQAIGEPPTGVGILGAQVDAAAGVGVDNNGGADCVAYVGRTPLGTGVRAQAVCAGKEALVLSLLSGRVMDPASTSVSVKCPDGFALTGCTCSSENAHCIGSYPSAEDADECVAQLGPSSSYFTAGGRAGAQCLYKGDAFASAAPSRSAPAQCSATSWVAAKVGNQRWLDATMWRQMMSRRAAPMVGGAMGLILLGCFLGCCCLGLICCARSRHLRRKAMTANAGVPMLSQDGAAIRGMQA